MSSLVKIVILFIGLSSVVAILSDHYNVEFGNEDFWDRHSIFFLFFITLFPRLTLFFSNVPFGGLFWWLGFFIAPRFLVACLSSITYWNTNPVLVITSWLICLSGESGEKYIVTQKVSRQRHNSGTQYAERREANTINAEFKRKE
jgi:hypothetical protein